MAAGEDTMCARETADTRESFNSGKKYLLPTREKERERKRKNSRCNIAGVAFT